MERALRQLRSKRVSNRGARELDIAAITRRFAATQALMPVWRARKGRWLELSIIVELSASMRFWYSAAAAFTTLAARGSAASTVRMIGIERPLPNTEQRPLLIIEGGRTVRELRFRGGASLALYLTDCLGPGWLTGEIPMQLARMVRQTPLVVMHMLPKRFWSRTGLANALPLPAHRSRHSAFSIHHLPAAPLLVNFEGGRTG